MILYFTSDALSNNPNETLPWKLVGGAERDWHRWVCCIILWPLHMRLEDVLRLKPGDDAMN
jgi:hypothetical protein